jgi:hypothetical protein
MKTTKRAVLVLCACLTAAALPARAELKTGDQLFQVFVGPDKMVGQQRHNYDTGIQTGGDYFIHAAPQVAFGLEGRFEEPGTKTISLGTNPATPGAGVLPQQTIKYRAGGAAALLRFDMTPKSSGTPYVLLGFAGNYINIETFNANLISNTTSSSLSRYWRGGGIGAFGYDYVDESGWTGGLEARYDTYDKADQAVSLLLRFGYKF